MRFNKVIIWILVIIVLFITITLFIYKKNVSQPASSTNEKITFDVKEGDGIRDIAKSLSEKSLLKHPTTFIIYLKLNGLTSMVKAGVYQLDKNMNIIQITGVLTEGKVKTSKVTIPEGLSNKQIAELLDEKNIIKKEDFLDAASKKYDYDFLKLKPDKNSVEGYLYPDTYFFSANVDGEAIINKMLDNFDKKLDNNLRAEIEKQGKSVNEILTLASIIEKENSNDDERSVIAGIFYKRMKYNMPLEADATVNYVTGKKSPSISSEDKKTDSPYNTYKNKGLPPGPICNPSLSAIKAAIFPKESAYFYYLNRQDTKETLFSETYDEHLEKQRKYLQ